MPVERLGRSDATHLIAVVEQGAPDVSVLTGDLAAVGLAFVDADRARHTTISSNLLSTTQRKKVNQPTP